ncbi:MAG: LOG family protein [Pseudomonadota bacterium]
MTDKKKNKPNARQLAAPAYRLAAFDQDFLLDDAMRGVRFHLEYEKAERALRAWGVNSTIVVFGSARITENGNGEHGRWYAMAREFAKIASERGGALDRDHSGRRENVITTGGGGGVMEAANRGAADAGAPSIGLNIRLPHEQEPNAYSTPDLTFQFHYFGMRKMHFAMRAAALVIFPGGFGTLDELFELLTLVQTGKSPAIPIVLFDEPYWSEILNIRHIADHGLISPQDLALFQYASTPEEAWRKLVDAGLAGASAPGGAPEI